MKKVGLVGVAISLLLSLTVLAAEKSANKQAKSPGGQSQAAKDQGKAPQGRQRMDPAAQLDALKKQHQATIAELQAIKQLAVKEKATQTAAAIDKLIARNEQEYQKKVEPLQQRLKRAEGDKVGVKQAQKGDGAKKKTSK